MSAEAELTPTVITAGRVVLRPWEPTDAGAVLAACQDEQLQRWTRVPVPYLLEHAEQYVGVIGPSGWTDGTAAHFAVLEAVGGELVASISLMGIDRSDAVAELGYWAAAPARGRGLTTEAVGALCRWGFSAAGLRRISWWAQVGNAASRRVAEKAGFRYEGVARGRLTARDGSQADAWQAALLWTDDPATAPPWPAWPG